MSQNTSDEFDQLYEEGEHRRRMMVVSLHDRISGHAGRVRALDRFLGYAKGKQGVWLARKDEIAALCSGEPCWHARHQSQLTERDGLARPNNLKKRTLFGKIYSCGRWKQPDRTSTGLRGVVGRHPKGNPRNGAAT